MKNVYPSEEEEQVKVIEYLYILEAQKKVLWFCASASGQFQKSWSVKAKMKRTGVRPGMPDLMICFQKYLVFIEMKRVKGGTVTDDQKKAIEAINMVGDPKGVVAGYIARGFDEAKTIIDFYTK